MSATIGITMAGLGSRFAEAGYSRPKYEILVHDRPLFDWSMLSLTAFRDAGWRFHFIARSGLNAPEYIAGRATTLGLSDYLVTEVDALTDGQATTALIAAKKAEGDQPFAVYNIDTFVAPGAMIPPEDKALSGWLPCFAAPGDGWSFARLDDAGKVVEIREKKRISDHATVGLYWFDHARRYEEVYESFYFDQANMEKGERYIAPMYNGMIAQGLKVEITSLEMGDVGMLGTPQQVDAFRRTPPKGAISLLPQAPD